ncbi:MAG: hypothetical protein ABSF84_10815 [Acidimicrobiales bacterium]
MSADSTSTGGAPGAHDRPDEIHRRARRMAWAYTLAAVVLVPWTAYLALSLPRRDVDTHYRAAWVGFDILLVAAIVQTAYYAFKVDTRVQLPATATATLLVVDAWFDVMTAGGHRATFDALVLALVVELPAAAFSLYLARRVNHNAERAVEARLGLGRTGPDQP